MSPCNCLFYLFSWFVKLIGVQLYYKMAPPRPPLHRRPASLSLTSLGPRLFHTEPLAPPVEIWPGTSRFTYSKGSLTGVFSCHTQRLWAGNCCLRHPFSPVLEPRQGGDICYSGWVNLAPRNYSSNNVLLAVQAWGTPSAWRHVPRPPIRWSSRSVGSYPSLASIFPAHYCPLHGLVSFIARHNIN